ncbi:M28 family metallopeptidase [Epilithonimonas ginsengisoli]|uniref:M28 family metallopeptidase n=1 Tax=Epilithonimonas ginsengisoli TaxID=1245592 RepID=A0ABU4JJ67_9FLAO|nr:MULTISPECIES: M28 family metallopeptidase [Chryseobacterium group]MBV6880273.1 M28 family peptidase [Epilithonimonas sp. FP105]MDW8549725.1 M28 family metallopeptidase [Epilithonimonas ginsengisoli]OAH72193.1 peptidase M28 [Chryseobacterium sp. FP211-J200]
MKNIKLYGFLAGFALLQSCSAAKNFTYEGKGFKDAYNKISLEDLKTNLYVIAADDMEGRDTGSAGQKKAGVYMIEQYKKYGIGFPEALGSYYQKVPTEAMKKYGEALPDSENILAYIEGSEKPNEVIVISGHYDHVGTKNGVVYNGADDDGSGTVAVMEIAKAFQEAKKKGYGPKRSILFLHVTGEEHGLFGSEYYSDNPVFPLANTVADLNIDMIGRDDPENRGKQYVYVIGSEMLSTELKKINETANQKSVNLELNYKYDDPKDPQRLYYRSDHYNFAKHNIPVAFFFDGIHEDYHKPSDKPDKIDYPLLQKRTQLVFTTAWELANRPERIKVDGKSNR